MSVYEGILYVYYMYYMFERILYVCVCIFVRVCGKTLNFSRGFICVMITVLPPTTLPGDFLTLKLRGVTLKKREALISK